MRLTGKRALITGAARGLGRATAVAFAEQGADLVLLDISADVPRCPYPLGTVSQLKATAEECRAAGASVPTMVAQRSGSVVNVSSTAGMVGYRYFAGYVAAKHGLIGLAKAAALDYAPHGVRVNALCPGSVRDEPALEGRMLVEIARCLDVPTADHEQTFIESQPMNRLVEASDVASTAVWPASDESRQVTGAVVPVDGGFTAR
ncbi:SDR family oxidoreductase [Streptomyces adustus]|uniref:SDR family oxidoreductase n=1 Tax=Streptomyces adustus TaxID=1609272 RepID=UPI003721AF69